MITATELYYIGRLRKPHGKRGEVVLSAENDMLDIVDPAFVVLSLEGIFVPFEVAEVRSKGIDYILSLIDVTTEEMAQRLCQTDCYLLRRELPADIEEEMPIESLVGYSVISTDGKLVGTIKDIDDSTQNILLLLHNDLVLPYHEDLVEHFNQDKKLLIMTIPEGL